MLFLTAWDLYVYGYIPHIISILTFISVYTHFYSDTSCFYLNHINTQHGAESLSIIQQLSTVILSGYHKGVHILTHHFH